MSQGFLLPFPSTGTQEQIRQARWLTAVIPAAEGGGRIAGLKSAGL